MDLKTLVNNSIILVNKPPGKSSHEITTWVKKIVGARRAGHAGTLDPEVSGVLPVALGRATKLLRYIAGKEKTYVGIIKFRNVQTETQIRELFKKFTGELIQTPPKQSAVRKVPRKRTVYSLEFLEISESNPRLVLFKTRVDAGTYIRTLCEYMGKLVGGSRMEELRRIAVGRINEGDTITMHDLIDAVWLLNNKNDSSGLQKILKPPQHFIDLPRVTIKNTALKSLLSGAQLTAPGIKQIDENVGKGACISIYSENGEFVGVGITQAASDEIKGMERGIAVKIERIHLDKK